MSDVQDDLYQLLTNCSKDSLTVGHQGPAAAALNVAIAGDLALQKHAWEVISRDTMVKDRDHLSRWRIALLTRALASV